LSASTSGRIVVLSSLYFSQGLPFGFFTQAIPVWMRQQGWSLTLIGASSVLALPWALKFLWAPLVDRTGPSRWGRRRRWILPLQLAQVVAIVGLAIVGLGATTQAAGGAPVQGLLVAMATAMALTNLLSATQDIATDGLAVDILRPEERGLGNGVQVAAYRVGMVVGGGALLAAFGVFGWTPTLLTMAAILVVMSVPTWLLHEPSSSAPTSSSSSSPPSWWAWWGFFRRGGGRMAVWAAGIAMYKIGDALGSPMARTLLIDRGFDVVDVAWLLGTLGSVAGMVGALLGGIVARRRRLAALVGCGLVHAGLMAAYGLPIALELGLDEARFLLGALVVLEHVTGGMATVSLFTAMMDAALKETGASDYTAQASVVVAASGVGSALSGVVADGLGYGWHFLVAGVVCVVGSVGMIPLYRRGIAPSPGEVHADRESERGGAA
jgi:PAT family beta-lactamase induction signal transducer AmpG